MLNSQLGARVATLHNSHVPYNSKNTHDIAVPLYLQHDDIVEKRNTDGRKLAKH